MKGRLRELLIAVIDGDKKGSIYHEHSELSNDDDEWICEGRRSSEA